MDIIDIAIAKQLIGGSGSDFAGFYSVSLENTPDDTPEGKYTLFTTYEEILKKSSSGKMLIAIIAIDRSDEQNQVYLFDYYFLTGVGRVNEDNSTVYTCVLTHLNDAQDTIELYASSQNDYFTSTMPEQN